MDHRTAGLEIAGSLSRIAPATLVGYQAVPAALDWASEFSSRGDGREAVRVEQPH